MSDAPAKSKLLRFLIGYLVVVIVLVYSVDWIDRHREAIGAAVLLLLSGIGLWITMRVIAWWRNRTYW